MTFLNKKEDVIDVQLTQHGKRLLAEGKFNPAYYSITDNDIIYDAAKAGFSEAQNDAHSRILQETNRLAAQYIFYDAEREINSTSKQETNIPCYEIGTFDLNATAKPAWNIKYLHGEVSSSVNASTGSHAVLPIPQLSSSIVYRTYISQDDIKPTGEDIQLSTKIFADGTYISIVPEHILLDITEENVDYISENFDIEVFLVEEQNLSGSMDTPGIDPSRSFIREILIPLSFVPQEDNVINDILIDQELPEVELTTDYVEYYFNLFTDFEIDKEVLCVGVQEIKSKGVNIDDSDLIDCPEQGTVVRMNPYYSTTSDLENCEPE